MRQSVGWRALRVLAGGLLGAIALNVGAALADTASFTNQGCSPWPVPAGVSSVQVIAVGAAGSDGVDHSGGVKTLGGLGDGVSATQSVIPGQSLDVCVDSGGGLAADRGGAGGGASGVAAGTDFSVPVVVAGGGGGGSSPSADSMTGAGGGGAGQPSGGSGGNSSSSAGGGTTNFGGRGGDTATMMGGAGGPEDNTFGTAGGNGAGFTPGGPGTGGAGAADACDGGGGGAGYFGGGGGAAGTACGGGGGGGGSDFCALSVSLCTVTAGQGAQTVAGSAPGDAQVILSFTPAAAPGASITAPAAGATYTQGQVVDSSFDCAEGGGGTGIATCLDQSGHPSGSAVDTSTTGPHALTVTATSTDGLTAVASVGYTVVAAPAAPSTSTPAPTSKLQLAAPRFLHAALGSRSFLARKGTRLELTLSASASVKVVITRHVTGHTRAGVCRAHATTGARCMLHRDVKTLHLKGVAGSNRLRLLVKSLRPGSYTVKITASDSAGSSGVKTLRFKIRETKNRSE